MTSTQLLEYLTMSTKTFNKRVGGRNTQRGQGMTEYIIIVALVAIGAIGVYSAFGRTAQAQMAQITNGLAGSTGGVNTNKALATTEAGKATTDANTQLGLDTYGQNVKDQ
jgi:Flp pilus assembly pilin Flp